MEIITGATYAYFNRVGTEWTQVGLIGSDSVREIIARRSGMGHKLSRDYAFKREEAVSVPTYHYAGKPGLFACEGFTPGQTFYSHSEVTCVKCLAIASK